MASGHDANTSYVPLADRIVDGLREDIVTGKIPPGARVRQQAIAVRYDASRLPVREALQRLQAEGLITLTSHVGARVAVLDRHELDEIYKIREHLEPLALEESTPRLTDADIADITSLIERMESLDLNTASARTEWGTVDRSLHLRTYSAAPLPRLLQMIEGLWNATQHYRLAAVTLPDTVAIAHSEHRLLLDALVRRDAEDAMRISQTHIRRTRLSLDAHTELFDWRRPGKGAGSG